MPKKVLLYLSAMTIMLLLVTGCTPNSKSDLTVKGTVLEKPVWQTGENPATLIYIKDENGQQGYVAFNGIANFIFYPGKQHVIHYNKDRIITQVEVEGLVQVPAAKTSVPTAPTTQQPPVSAAPTQQQTQTTIPLQQVPPKD
ncbi:MAG: hypothetical protein M1355_02765 [Patescibacteria group bacterium]|nr:hypothetical protein [Patescibacteria group bacterium]